METTPEVLALAERLSKFPNNEVVEVLREMPGLRPSVGTQAYLEALAWVRGSCPDELEREGLPGHLILGARLLERESWMTLHGYYRRLDGAPELVRIVKVCECVVLLRAGSSRVRDHEAREYIVPLTMGMGEPWGSWLRAKLEESLCSANDS